MLSNWACGDSQDCFEDLEVEVKSGRIGDILISSLKRIIKFSVVYNIWGGGILSLPPLSSALTLLMFTRHYKRCRQI